MLIESTEYNSASPRPNVDHGAVFKYCSFSDLTDGFQASVEADFLSCTFNGVEFYWSLFNSILVYDCTFENCSFRGASFADSRFVDCKFINCQFTPGNIGGDCSFDSSKWYGCTQLNCIGLNGF